MPVVIKTHFREVIGASGKDATRLQRNHLNCFNLQSLKRLCIGFYKFLQLLSFISGEGDTGSLGPHTLDIGFLTFAPHSATVHDTLLIDFFPCYSITFTYFV
jgi:hypothetical protein